MIVVRVSSWSSRLRRVLVQVWSILFKNLIVSLSLTILSFIEFIFAFVLWKSVISLLTFIRLMRLIEPSTLIDWFIVVIIILVVPPWVWWILSHVIVISWLIVFFSKIVWISINRSILVGSVFYWRVIFNDIRLQLISSQFLS